MDKLYPKTPDETAKLCSGFGQPYTDKDGDFGVYNSDRKKFIVIRSKAKQEQIAREHKERLKNGVLRTNWKPGEQPLTEEEQANRSQMLEEAALAHLQRNGPRFYYDEIAVKNQGEEEYKRREHLDGFQVSLDRMREIDLWESREDWEMDSILGWTNYAPDGNPTDEELAAYGYEDRSHPNAPKTDEEWRFFREAILPEKKERLENLRAAKAEELASRIDLARAVLLGDSLGEIEIKVADLKQLITDTMLPVLTDVQKVVVENNQGAGSKGRPPKYAKALTTEWKNRCDRWRERHPDKAFTPKEKECFVIDHFGYDEFNLSPGEDEQVKKLASYLRSMFEAGRKKPRKKLGG